LKQEQNIPEFWSAKLQKMNGIITRCFNITQPPFSRYARY
jgi:hypothetical protein